MNGLNNALTDDIISNIVNDKYKFIVTRDSILSSLNDRLDSFNSSIIFYIICIIFILFLTWCAIKQQKHLIRFISAFLIACVLGVNIYGCIRKKNIIEYSIEHNCWSIEKDIVIDRYKKNSISLFSLESYFFDILYCLKLNRYGEITVTIYNYQNLQKNDIVYVVCVQDKSGKKYPVSAWPFKETLFIESLQIGIE